MTVPTELHRLAHAYGVQVGYTDLGGKRVYAQPETLLAVLAALGAPVTTMADVPGALRERRAREARKLVEPVLVAWNGRVPPIEVRLTGRHTHGVATAAFHLEDGDVRSVHRDLGDIPLTWIGRSEGEDVEVRAWTTGLVLPLGYHRLRLTAGGHEAEVHVIAAPERAETASLAPPPGQGPEGTRAWGSFLPTYALRDPDDWGVGDYTRLGDLVRWTGERGGRAVATLPLLPAFLEEPLLEPSPYAPTSRLCWNELYVDPTAEPEWKASDEARALTADPAWLEERDRLRGAEKLDYKRLFALRKPALAAMARTLHAQGGPRLELFRQFLDERPVVTDYARFRAAVESRGCAWQHWPDRMRAGSIRDAELLPDAVRTWEVAQWYAHLQMQRVAADGRERGTGLLLDLPLGVHSCGYDTWRWPHLFAHGMGAGAPPDSFFTKGQCWGFPPRIPEAQRKDGYRYLVATLRHHLRHATVLRVDHVMSLLRLYWVPHGMEATHGCYVRGRLEEETAVLCLESHRHGATIIGEDLGTVPRGVRPCMERHDVRRLSVLQFGVGGGAPSQPNPRAVASLNTHDMPTFEAFRKGLDIDDLESLGLFDDDGARDARAWRTRVVRELRQWLVAEGRLAPHAGDDDLVLACLEQLGRGPSPLLLVNLEDLWHETRPHNVPGTWRERPNWRRRARHGPGELAALPGVESAITRLRASRQETCPPAGDLALETPTILDDMDRTLFRAGRHLRLHEKLGARPALVDEVPGLHALHWAPGAEAVELEDATRGLRVPMEPRGDDLWEVFVPGRCRGHRYRYHVTRGGTSRPEGDPMARRLPPGRDDLAEVVDLSFAWTDAPWRTRRRPTTPPRLLEVPDRVWDPSLDAATLARRLLEFAGVVVPEGLRGDEVALRGAAEVGAPLPAGPGRGPETFLVLPSWSERRTPAGADRPLVADVAPASRLGSPAEAAALVDTLHAHGVGVVLAWPAEGDAVDGRPVVEDTFRRPRARPDSDPEEVRRGKAESYLLSTADAWLERYHVDGLLVRTRALRDRAGAGNPLLQAAEILQRLERELGERHPGAIVAAGWRADTTTETAPVLRAPGV